MKKRKSMWSDMTFADLRKWAGNEACTLGEKDKSSVSDLSQVLDGTLVARVSGNGEHVAIVRRDGCRNLTFDCTCSPEGGEPCRHAVAVLFATSDHVRQGKQIPLLGPGGSLSRETFGRNGFRRVKDDLPGLSASARGLFPQIEAMLAERTREQLHSLLIEQALAFPQVLHRLLDMARIERGGVDQLVRALREEVRTLTSQDAWSNKWSGEGDLPDYSHVREQLRALLIRGHTDAVVEIGDELWRLGTEQIGRSADDGETASSIASCLEVVLQALPKSSRTPSEQLLWRVKHEMNDTFELLAEGRSVLKDPQYVEQHWREVAVFLEGELDRLVDSGRGGFHATRDLDHVVEWLQIAYRRSGDVEKAILLLQRKAERCHQHDRLAKLFMERGDHENARKWCIQGFSKNLGKSPGIAGELLTLLREMAEKEGRQDLVAAYRADGFFGRHSLAAYMDLQRAAEKAGVWPAVRKGILAYLQTGVRPDLAGEDGKTWPLPGLEVDKPESGNRHGQGRFPDWQMLIEIALHEERNGDAVAIYKNLPQMDSSLHGIGSRVARAIAGSQPDVALRIWLSIAESLIGETRPRSYKDAVEYLRVMRGEYQRTGRMSEWYVLFSSLREKHRAKRRFLELLNALENPRR